MIGISSPESAKTDIPHLSLDAGNGRRNVLKRVRARFGSGKRCTYVDEGAPLPSVPEKQTPRVSHNLSPRNGNENKSTTGEHCLQRKQYIKSTQQSILPSTHSSTHRSIHPSIHLSAHLSISASNTAGDSGRCFAEAVAFVSKMCLSVRLPTAVAIIIVLAYTSSGGSQPATSVYAPLPK